MKHYSQRGLSFLGFIGILVILLIGGLLAMKISPMYLEYNSVKKSMEGLATETFDSPRAVREALDKRMSINYVENVKKEHVTVASKNGAYEVSVDYYVDEPLIGNLTISGHFQHSVQTSN